MGFVQKQDLMTLRDSESNMVKACEDWQTPHFPCIVQSLHLVIGPFLIEKKKKDNESEDRADDERSDEEGKLQEDAYTDDFTDAYNDAEALARVRKIVAKVRKTTKYIRNSTKSKELLVRIEELKEYNRILRVSMYDKMLKRALDLKEAITKFLRICESPTGRREFSGEK